MEVAVLVEAPRVVFEGIACLIPLLLFSCCGGDVLVCRLADTSHFCVKRPPNVMGGGLFVALVVCLKSTAGYAGGMQGDRSLSIYLGDKIGGFAQACRQSSPWCLHYIPQNWSSHIFAKRMGTGVIRRLKLEGLSHWCGFDQRGLTTRKKRTLCSASHSFHHFLPSNTLQLSNSRSLVSCNVTVRDDVDAIRRAMFNPQGGGNAMTRLNRAQSTWTASRASGSAYFSITPAK